VTLTILPVTPIAVLQNQINGRLTPEILVDVPGGRLLSVTARKWNALRAACLAATGHELYPTSYYDTYRTYDVQYRTFMARYIPEVKWNTQPPGTTNQRKVFNGIGYWKRIGVATSAVPGTSNHGWARAIDMGVRIFTDQDKYVIKYVEYDPDGSGPIVSALRWLEAGQAVRYGFSWETVPSEPWHIRDVTGDLIPEAVIKWEQDNSPVPPPPPPLPIEDEDEMRIFDYAPNTTNWVRLVGNGTTLTHVQAEYNALLVRAGAPIVTINTQQELEKMLDCVTLVRAQPVPEPWKLIPGIAQRWIAAGGSF
jgi:hypothetical protein